LEDVKEKYVEKEQNLQSLEHEKEILQSKSSNLQRTIEDINNTLNANDFEGERQKMLEELKKYEGIEEELNNTLDHLH
jgi:hypothetical protein